MEGGSSVVITKNGLAADETIPRRPHVRNSWQRAISSEMLLGQHEKNNVAGLQGRDNKPTERGRPMG
eukprot:6199763-Pyramimonas_sp.AAC.1